MLNLLVVFHPHWLSGLVAVDIYLTKRLTNYTGAAFCLTKEKHHDHINIK